MNRVVHKLKIDEEFLDAKLRGDKLFEIRYNDRGYQKGDITEYKKWNEDTCSFDYFRYEITYVTSYKQKSNFVVFGERKIEVKDEHKQMS